MAKRTPEERIHELEAENQRLSKALKLEKLRSEAYSTMIDLAEKTFNIPVRKNLAPNGRTATQEVPGDIHRSFVRAMSVVQPNNPQRQFLSDRILQIVRGVTKIFMISVTSLS